MRILRCISLPLGLDIVHISRAGQGLFPQSNGISPPWVGYAAGGCMPRRAR